MPGRVTHSPGITVSHLAARAETAEFHHETISPDHSFCGITKLEDLLSPELLQQIGLPPQDFPAFLAEGQQVIQLLQGAGIDLRQTRHTLRNRLGDGGYQHTGKHISRSEAVRAAFDRASDIAAENDVQIVMVHHLLAALLEIPNTKTRELLGKLGIDIATLRKEAAALSVPSPVQTSSTDLLNQLGTDLTEKARAGELPPVIGRKTEMLQVIKVLGRDKKNCPVLVGMAGVGKTAIVEGLAQRIASKNIHPDFHNKRIVQLDVSTLVSGTKYRGEFEERMTHLVTELAANPDLILFIDEIHLLVGAGAIGSGGMDAANILKAGLASGKIKLIGATTAAEYRQYIEKDAALERRFETVRIQEPSQQDTVEMLMGVRQRLQDVHGVTILDEAIMAAIELSVRYISDRYLPDKAYTLLDDACSEARYGSVLSYRPDQIELDGPFKTVTEATIRVVLADRLGIPVKQLEEDEKERIMQMPDALRQRVFGQDNAIDRVARVIQRYYSPLSNQTRPIGVLLFAGPTGVGKTELAKAVAEFLFHDERRMVRLDMSEYMDKYNVSRLIGAPPGYIGHEDGGQLTNALRQTRHTVVLIDEIEKAHPDVAHIFLQLFDEGRITDSHARTVDAKNALFIMTTNLGYSNIEPTPTQDAVQHAISVHFRPEFLGRIDEIVIFDPLPLTHMESIVRLQFERLNRKLESELITVQYEPEAVQWLAMGGQDLHTGARGLIGLFNRVVTDRIGGMFLSGQLRPGERARVGVQNDELVIEQITPPTNYEYDLEHES